MTDGGASFAVMTVRSDNELVEFSKRLLHNVQLYFRLSRTLTRVRLGFDPEAPWDTSSAQVESFAMHTRAMADFFYRFKRGRHASDAFAFDFFSSSQEPLTRSAQVL